MKYVLRVNKRIRNVRVYAVLKKLGTSQNIVTSLFLKVFGGKKSTESKK